MGQAIFHTIFIILLVMAGLPIVWMFGLWIWALMQGGPKQRR